MTDRPDPVAERRAELERRLASLTPAQRAKLAVTAAPPPEEHTIPRRSPEAPVPMSFAQELLWRLERARPGHIYNVPRSVRLTGRIDVDALTAALDALVARHEALRTTFALIDDEPRLVVNAAAPVHITHVDIGGLPDDMRESAARTKIRELAREPFDLEKDLQLRAALIRLSEEDHILLLISHHVSSDAWSGNILMRDLAALYEGYRDGRPYVLPPLDVQYADFAVWQRRTLTGERLESLLAYWRSRLEGAPTHLDLPTDRASPLAPSFEGAIRGTNVPLHVLDGLRSLSRAQNSSTFTVLLSTLYVLLMRYSGEEELVVATPIAGRPYPELEGIVGFFTNTLLLRASLAGNPTFRELLERVRSVVLGAHEHQEMPLETLMRAKGPHDRPLANSPQVVLSTEDPDRQRLHIPGTSSTPFAATLGGTKFDITIWSAERPTGLRVTAEFRTDLFDDETIDRMLRHFGVLLEAAVTMPDTRIGDLPIMDDDERQRVLYEWNDTEAGYPDHATIHGLIEEQVRRRPSDVAVECTENGERTTLTYAELDRRANRLASTLHALGVRADERVAICLDRGVSTAVAILGVLKAGGAYLPIDPAYPDDRIEYTLLDAGAAWMLTDERNHERLVGLTHAARLLMVDAAVRDGSSDAAPDVAVSPRHLAYVIYTSGSTGRPKGCMIEHRNVTRLLVNNRSLFDFNERDVWTVFHSFAFDFSVWELFGALVFGGRAVVVPRLVAQSPADFLALLQQSGTTILNQVPSAFQALLEEAVTGNPTLAVRYIIFGGEALKPALLRKWRQRWPKTRLINMFGITETTVHVTFKEIGDAEIAAGVSNIGRPIPTTTVYMLDQALRPVPIGLGGEICVGGLGVARGYLNRPDLTSERFVPDPFVMGQAAGARMYRSGDLGRRRANGEIEYIGRRDHQVKIRGHRIELGEIEAVLLQQPHVAEAVVMVREDSPDAQRLVAYVVPEPDSPPSLLQLREAMRQRLPEVMVPSAIEFLDRLPITSNGKVDLRALPAPLGSATGPAYQSPRTTIEHELAQIWERLLSPGRPIGAFDDFFEIGGHSLLAMQMLADVERVRGQRIPLAWLFESSTVESLAARLAAALFDEQEPPLITLQEGTSGPPVVFVHGDWTGGGWYARRLAPLAAANSPFYVLPTIGAGNEARTWTVEAMAERHVQELRKKQPRGPYRIVGFCVGGVIAFEMARQLKDAGEAVERLVVVDSDPMNARLRALKPLVSLLVVGTGSEARLTRQATAMRRLRWILRRVRYVKGLSMGERTRWFADKAVRYAPRLVTRAAPVPSGRGVAPSSPRGDVDNELGDAIVLRTQERAASAYVPGQYAGVLDFIWAEGAPGKERRPNPLGAWQIVAREVRMHPVASGHIGLITDNLPLFASALREVLDGS